MIKHTKKILLPLIFGLTLIGFTAESKTSPYLKPNNSAIILKGKITEAKADEFTLDYGKGSIVVEMDDYDWFAEGYNLLEGDIVTVTGKVDADKGEARTIEAGSVYIQEIDTYLYANSADEEDIINTKMPVIDGSQTFYEVKGHVTNISATEFDVKLNGDSIRVDIEKLKQNPLDNKGYIKLREGDFVSVFGEFDKGFFEEDEIDAVSIVKYN